MRKFRWVVEFLVDETWVADGFNLTDERAKKMIEHDLNCSYGHETSAIVIEAPSADKINKAQGGRGL